MLYKTVAYVYLVALTMTLLFTTSQADFNVDKGKETTRTFFNRLIRIGLEDKSNNLEGLIKTTQALVTDTPLVNYLRKHAAKDEKVCYCLGDAITKYEREFQSLVSGIKVGQKEDKKIPIYNTLKNLGEICNSTYGQGSTSKTVHTVQDSKGSASLSQLFVRVSSGSTSNRSITLKPFLAEEDEVPVHRRNENVNDEFGFKINKGILEVKILLDQFLQLALHTTCDTFKNLKEFADDMTENTLFYDVVLAAVPQCKDNIKRYVKEYVDNFTQMIDEAGPEFLLASIPIYDKLYEMQFTSDDDDLSYF